ncbi:MAG: diguanylate cyclase [Betaproteobacteria bacterium]|nr:MAG: diguanylate cyclase [Betaproteobacteria bacterium]
MDFAECISDQIAAAGRPLVGVTLAAVPCPDTPLILTLHWHGFVEERIAPVETANPVRFSSVPSSALQLNMRWDELMSLDLAAMEAGWELGAWDVARSERAGCDRPGAPARETLECRQAFGALPAGAFGEQLVVQETPDADELIDVASRSGYVLWSFRPVHGGIWAEVSDDATLRADGTRHPPCPHRPVPPGNRAGRHTVYRFGVASGGIATD